MIFQEKRNLEDTQALAQGVKELSLSDHFGACYMFMCLNEL